MCCQVRCCTYIVSIVRNGAVYFSIYLGRCAVPYAAFKQPTPILKSLHNVNEQNGAGEEHVYMYIRPNVFTLRCLHIFRLYDLISTFSVNYQRDVEYCIILYFNELLSKV